MSFTVSYGAITLTTELWYEIEKDTSSDAPRLYVIVTNWVKNYLKALMLILVKTNSLHMVRYSLK